LLSIISALGACVDPAETPLTVRDRLASGEAQLVALTAESGGSITARRRTSDGWASGTATLSVSHGELTLVAGKRGSLSIDHLALDLGPVELPSSLLGYEAQLTDIRLRSGRPTASATVWTGDDLARTTAQLPLELTWSLTIRGEPSPLGAPRLPPVPIELVLTGDADSLRAELSARSPGLLWSWADLLKLEDLTLFVTASTPAP
jgi:hypothetical protein